MDNKNIIIIITSSFTQSPVGCAVTKPRRNNIWPLLKPRRHILATLILLPRSNKTAVKSEQDIQDNEELLQRTNK